MRAAGIGLDSFVLAFGLLIGAGADSPYALSIHLQTDRPVYVVGQTVRLRFVITTETTLFYWNGYTPTLKIVDAQNKPVRHSTGVEDPSGHTAPGRRGEFRPGNNTLQTYGWRRARVLRQWFDLGSLGYHIGQPGKYMIVADGSLEDYSVLASPPVTIRVLTKATAKMQPPDVLADTKTNAALGKLANKYLRLRSDLVRMLVLMRRGATWQDIVQAYATWDDDRVDAQDRIDGLPSSGNPH